MQHLLQRRIKAPARGRSLRCKLALSCVKSCALEHLANQSVHRALILGHGHKGVAFYQLSHHGGDEGYMEKLTNYDTFAIEQFGYFLTRLSETKDLNGKSLLLSLIHI